MLLYLAQLLPESGPHPSVQRRERFVEQQQGGADRQRTGDRHPLLLSPRKLGRVAMTEASKLHRFQQIADPSLDFSSRCVAYFQAITDVLGNGHMRKQRIGLKDYAKSAITGRNVDQIPAVEADFTAVSSQQTGDNA